MHREGWHFPAKLVEAACKWYGVAYKVDYDHQLVIPDDTSGQIEDEQWIKTVIRESFPNLPDSEVDTVYEHAWKEVRYMHILRTSGYSSQPTGHRQYWQASSYAASKTRSACGGRPQPSQVYRLR
jgi:hypothetical protein